MKPMISNRITTMTCLAAAALLGMGCSSSSFNQTTPPPAAVDSGGTGGSDATATTGPSDNGTGSTTSDAGGTGLDTSQPPVQGANVCNDAKACPGNRICADGVCVPAPTDMEEAVLTDNCHGKECSVETIAEPVDVSCANLKLAAPAGPATTTMYGIVDRFGSGLKTFPVEVAVFKASEWPPANCVSLPMKEQRECIRTAKSPWTATSTDPTAPNPTVPASCVHHVDCPAGYECIEDANGENPNKCDPQWGHYSIDGVPTNTLLVVRSKSASASVEKKWRDAYVVGIYLYADRVKDGRYRSNALMVSDAQWKQTPSLLAVGSIQPGLAAVGGRVRDCGTASRKSLAVGHSSIDLARPGETAYRVGYFNDNEEDTVPINARTTSDIFGRFVAVNVPPGPNRIGAAAKVGGNVKSLGAEDIYVVPDSLLIVAFPGKDPVLNK